MLKKIKNLPELAKISAQAKSEGRQVVLCHGVFDLLHPGHIRHLNLAKEQGHLLIVTLTADRHVNKGPGRPAFNQALRAESMAAIACVDYVAINDTPTAVEAIRLLKPSVYVKGSEYAKAENDLTGKIRDEEEAVLAVGGRIHFTDDVTYSSSHLINNFINVFPPETEAWLGRFRKKYSADQILEVVENVSNLRTLVIGESIIDEYVFCDGLGKSTKDPILAFLYRGIESYAGGSLAVANHVAGFCKSVRFASYLGDIERKEAFIRDALRPNVEAHLLTRRNTPTIHKRRFIDTHTNARLFEIYHMNDVPVLVEDEQALLEHLERLLPEIDVVIAMDYGHGMMTPKVISTLCARSKFLAVNTQANAGNRGFNTISKYPRADYACLAGHEIALETRMKHSPFPELILEVTRRLDCRRFTVTYGKSGSLHYEADQGFVEVPAFATKVTDRVGAGDGVMAITSLLAAQNAPWEIVGFLGNLAGAQMVADLGNRTVLNKTALLKHAVALMK